MDDNNLLDQTTPQQDNHMTLDNTQDPQPTPNTPITRRKKKKSKANRTKLPRHASNSKKPSTTTAITSERTQSELNKDHVEIVPNETNTSNTRQNPRPLRTRKNPERFQAGK